MDPISLLREWTPTQAELAKLQSQALRPSSPRVNVTESERAQLGAVNALEAMREYRERAKLQFDDPKAARQFSSVLAEKIDPALLDRVSLAGLDAYDAVLLGRKMAIRGDMAVSLAAFYGNPENRALFPEFVRRQVAEAPLRRIGYAMVDDIISAREMVGAITQTPTISATTGPAVGRVAAGANLPVTRIDFSSSAAHLYKVGGAFEIPYEVAARTPLNIAAIFFRRLGMQMDMDLTDLIVNTMFSGCSDQGDTATSGKITPLDLLKLVSNHEDAGYNPTALLSPPAMYEKILDNPAIQDPKAYDVIRTRRLNPVAGCEVKKVRATTDLGTTYVLAVDRESCASLFIEAGSELSETDKFIINQLDAYTFSMIMTPAVLLAAGARKMHLKS